MVEKSNNKIMRKFKRVEIELEVKYQPIKYHNWFTTVTKSIGTDGICLISKEYLGIGTTVNMQLSLTSPGTIIVITGKILWSDFLFDRKLYESGIKFSRLNDNEKDMISKYIDDFVRLNTGVSKN